MQLSPFDEGDPDDDRLVNVPLYEQPSWESAYEIVVARPGEEFNDDARVARPSEGIETSPPEFDIQAAEKSTEYVRVLEAFPRLRVRWLTQDQFKRETGYRLDDPPPPRGVPEDEWKDHWEKNLIGRGDQPSVTLNSDIEAYLTRFARLWNGEEVCGTHLLRDKCPSIDVLTEDLDEIRLERLYFENRLTLSRDASRKLRLAFGEFDWFPTYTPYFTDTHLLRKRVWYHPTDRVKTLINEHSSYPTLNGDPYERVPHRFTVGLGALWRTLEGDDVTTYYEHRGYNVDVAASSQNGTARAIEVITGHNGVTHNRTTYQKLRDLHSRGITPILLFDNRTTAYDVMSDWHRSGIAELPNGAYNSDPNIPTGREQIQTAYSNDDLDWVIADWHTTDTLWRRTLGQNGPSNAADAALSLDW